LSSVKSLASFGRSTPGAKARQAHYLAASR
jgi:hypothetical protein